MRVTVDVHSSPAPALSPSTTGSTRFVVPREHRSLLAVPALSDWPKLLERNRELLQAQRSLGEPRSAEPARDGTVFPSTHWGAIRRDARQELLAAARLFTQQVLGPRVPDVFSAVGASGPVIMTGHQPDLFHPGVWVKNFAAARAAHAAGGVAINLIIDNDLCGTAGLQVPVRTDGQLALGVVPWRVANEERPWEEVRVDCRQEFCAVPDALAGAMRPWGVTPLSTASWGRACRALNQSRRVCDAFAALRGGVERDWGAGTLELPVSRLVELRLFADFFGRVVSDAARFRDVYNAAVQRYRSVHRIRSTSHPVPDLKRAAEWIELPFWVWQAGSSQRGRLRLVVGPDPRLSDGRDWSHPLPDAIVEDLVAGEKFRTDRVGAWRTLLDELSTGGWKIRPRALTTTLLARAYLCDLFVHGIGGAQYDEMTDELARRWLDLELPAYATISAAYWLPLGAPSGVSNEQLGRVRWQLADLQHNPQRWLSAELLADDKTPRSAEAAQLLIERGEVAARLPESAALSRTERWKNYQRLLELNRALQPAVQTRHQELERRLQELLELQAADRVRKNREYPFVLYPADELRSFYAELLSPLDRQNVPIPV